MNLSYSKGTMEDLDAIHGVFQDAIIEMDRNNIPQWDHLYPNREDLKEDIENETLYVGKIENDIVVVFVLNLDADEQYSTGEWKYPDASYLVLHRFCVNPKYQNCGIGGRALSYVEEVVRTQGIETIRLDAFTRNPYAIRMYEKAGYEKVGTVDFRKGKFYLMEKLV